MTESKARRLQEMVECIVGDDESDLPEFRGYQMTESHGPDEVRATVYTGEDGDIWFDRGAENGACCFGRYEDEFIEAILRAYLAGDHE